MQNTAKKSKLKLILLIGILVVGSFLALTYILGDTTGLQGAFFSRGGEVDGTGKVSSFEQPDLELNEVYISDSHGHIHTKWDYSGAQLTEEVEDFCIEITLDYDLPIGVAHDIGEGATQEGYRLTLEYCDDKDFMANNTSSYFRNIGVEQVCIDTHDVINESNENNNCINY
jgi:hypothetical protein